MALLRVLSGQGYGRVYRVEEPCCALGRGVDCHLRDLFLQSPEVSRHHARIERFQDAYVLSDTSMHGTRVNGRPVCEPIALHDQDHISIGACSLLFLERGLSDSLALGEEAAGLTYFFEQLDDSSIQSRCDFTPPTAYPPNHGDERMRALVEMLTSLGRSLDLHHVLDLALAGLLRIYPQAERGFVGLRIADSDTVTPAAVKHRDPGRVDHVQVCRTIVRRVMTSGESIRLLDPSQSSLLQESESIVGLQLRSVMCAPLMASDGQALGVVQVDTSHRPGAFAHDDLEVMTAVARLIALAVEHSRLHEQAVAQQALQRDLEMARMVHRSLFPKEPPELGGFRFFAFCEAAMHVGGDYYDYIPLADGRLAVVLADASGKGVSAALWMTNLSAELKRRLALDSRPAEALRRINGQLLASECDGRFATMLLTVLDPNSDEILLVNAGHPPPLLRRLDGSVEPAGGPPRWLPLGIAPDESYSETCIRLGPGERLVMFSDGFPDALNLAGEEYGLDRLRQSVAGGPADVEQLGGQVVRNVRSYSASAAQTDDMCLICFGRS